jgi:pimeloyl-ACP methyl ester carboxylesterase
MQVGTMSLQGIDLQVVRQGSGRPIVWLHGSDGLHSDLPFFTGLSAHGEVIAPLHPGFAGSRIPEHFDGLEDLVYLYLDLLDALQLQDVILMGNDMGGWAATEMAVCNSRPLARLILVDAVGIKPGSRDTRDIADIFGLAAPEVSNLLFHDPARAPNVATMSEEQAAMLASDRIAHAMYTWHPYMHNPKLRHRLHRINVPTLFLWGASDGLVTVAYGEAYCALIPHARLAVIPEAGHFPHVEQPDRCLQHVLAFLAQ